MTIPHASLIANKVVLITGASSGIDEAVHVLQAGYVERAHLNAGTLRAQFGGQCFQPVEPARTQHQMSAQASQMPRGGFADAAAGAGDQHYLVGDMGGVRDGHGFSCHDGAA